MLILLKNAYEDRVEGIRRIIDTSILDVMELEASIVDSYRGSDSAPRILGLNCGDTGVTDGYNLLDAVRLQLAKYKLAGLSFLSDWDDSGKVILEDGVFKRKITKLDIPYGVVTLDDSIFYGLDSLVSVRIPPTVEVIGAWAFKDCISLKRIEFTGYSHLRTVHPGAFSFCSSLVEIDLPETVRDLDGELFSGCSELKRVSFGGLYSDLRSIESGCFVDCTKLTELDLPEGIRRIGRFALNNTSIKSLDLRLCPDLVKFFLERWVEEVNFEENSSENRGMVKTFYPRDDACVDIIVETNTISQDVLKILQNIGNIKIVEKDIHED